MSMDMITRTPYCHKIRYGVTGAPALTGDEMEGSHRPGIGLDPTLIELIYSPARDGKPATVSASVTGWWMDDGEVSQPQDSVATHFRNGPDGWPVWLVEEARIHGPAPAAGPAICELPHATIDEEDACERQRLGIADNARAVYRRLRAHLAGFQDVLDDSDRGPWAATVGADLDELGALLDADATNPAEETRNA
jgi:hypothetical protein